MLLAHGWAVIQSSREKYENYKFGDLEALDAEADENDKELWRRFRKWMKSNDDGYTVWELTERLNNHHGLLHFSTSRNHRASMLWGLLEWLAASSVSSYGLVYVFDDEDAKDDKNYERGVEDYSNSYRVWRVLKGEVEELDDSYLSPVVPRILPSFYA